MCVCVWFINPHFSRLFSSPSVIEMTEPLMVKLACGKPQHNKQMCLMPRVMPSFYWHGITRIMSRISDHIHNYLWDVITYPFRNFQAYIWVITSLFYGDLITYQWTNPAARLCNIRLQNATWCVLFGIFHRQRQISQCQWWYPGEQCK